MSSLVSYVLQVTSILLTFGVIAALLVRFGRRAPGRSSGPLELVARLPLEGRRVIYLVRAGERLLVVGGSDAGLSRLGELEMSPTELQAALPAGAAAPAGAEAPAAALDTPGGLVAALRKATLRKATLRKATLRKATLRDASER